MTAASTRYATIVADPPWAQKAGPEFPKPRQPQRAGARRANVGPVERSRRSRPRSRYRETGMIDA